MGRLINTSQSVYRPRKVGINHRRQIDNSSTWRQGLDLRWHTRRDEPAQSFDAKALNHPA